MLLPAFFVWGETFNVLEEISTSSSGAYAILAAFLSRSSCENRLQKAIAVC